MNRIAVILIFFIATSFTGNSIRISKSTNKLASSVQLVLEEYINILSTSANLDECANRFLPIAGGGLVNPEGDMLRNSVKPYSLKKDFENIHYYKFPVKIKRVVITQTKQAGYGKSALAGNWYKIYIAKKDGSQPAPIHIVDPFGHATIKTPKIIQIGSL